MAIEIKNFLKEIDLPETLLDGDDIGTAKEQFFASFVNRKIAPTDEEIVNAVSGKMLTRIESNLIKSFDIPADLVKGKKIEEIIDFGASAFKTKIKDLEDHGKSGNDEKVTKAEKALEKITGERDQYKNQLNEFKTTFEQKELELTGKLKKEKLNFHVSTIKGRVPLIDNVAEITKKGFDALINENYQFEFDEQEALIAKDKEGKLIPNATKSGFMSVEEVLKMEAQKAGILKMNNGSGTGGKRPVNEPNPPAAIPGRKLPVRPSGVGQ